MDPILADLLAAARAVLNERAAMLLCDLPAIAQLREALERAEKELAQ